MLIKCNLFIALCSYYTYIFIQIRDMKNIFNKQKLDTSKYVNIETGETL